MKILVTGGRDYNDPIRVDEELGRIIEFYGTDVCFIQGGANGVDKLCKLWCERNGVPCITMYAAWKKFDKAAGAIRNGWMLKYCQPDLVLAFPGGSGTTDMRKQAIKAGVKVYEIR